MGEADNALREEIEKVRERARLQALAQGLGPDAAALQGNAAVEEFCARWGIRPEMVGPGVMGSGRPRTTTGQPFRDDSHKVDLGASRMRTNTNPGQTQAIRIADLLKRAKDTETAASRPASPVSAGPPAGAPGNSPGPPRAGSNLSSLLQRMRTADSPQNPQPSQAPPRSYAPAPPAPAAPPSRPVFPPAPGTVQRAVTMGEPLGGGATLSANAERRRQVLEEFDRTYAEVQSMLEQRIGVVDIALNDASKGISGVMAKAQAGGLRPEEVETLAVDVDRLRSHLNVMMELCDEFLQHMNQINASRPGGR